MRGCATCSKITAVGELGGSALEAVVSVIEAGYTALGRPKTHARYGLDRPEAAPGWPCPGATAARTQLAAALGTWPRRRCPPRSSPADSGRGKAWSWSHTPSRSWITLSSSRRCPRQARELDLQVPPAVPSCDHQGGQRPPVGGQTEAVEASWLRQGPIVLQERPRGSSAGAALRAGMGRRCLGHC